MTVNDLEAAAASTVEEAGLACGNLDELMGCLARCFARVEPRRQARKYVTGLISDLPRKNCWALAEQAGDATPDKMQRLLERAAWDASDAMREVRTFVVSGLGDPAGAVLVLDESGQEKAGEHTAGVKRQYLGCAGRVANGINVVYASYAAPAGHAIIAARLYVPRDWADDSGRRAAAGIPEDLKFATKPQLAAEIVTELITEGRCPPWVTGDEVYGRDARLRALLEEQGTGYVMKIPCSFRVTLPAGQRFRADHAARLVPAAAWQTAPAGHGSKGERDYGWAWLATASARRHLLIRRRLTGPADLAFFYCHVPARRACSFTTLIRIAGRRRPVEEDFALGKSWFGLADSQVRCHTAITRHLALAMAALAACAVTAALARGRTSTLARPPTSPDDLPPQDPGLIPLTAAAHELGLFSLLSRRDGGSAAQVAADLHIAERPAEMLLTACASLGLLDKRDGQHRNAPIAEKYLVPGRPGYFGGFVAFNDKRLYGTYGQLTAAARSNHPVGWDPDTQRSFFDTADTTITHDFYEAMHSLSTATGQALATVDDLRTRSRLLDVGGGSGAIPIELCHARPGLKATVFDLPHVTDFAAAKIAAVGLSDRIATAAGDLFAPDPYPAGHDVALLSLIMHSFTPDQDRQILAKTRDCLPSGGLVVISELLVNDDKTGPPPAALMSLTMLIEDQGRNYTAAEYEQWLTETGFHNARRLALDVPGANGLVIAEKP